MSQRVFRNICVTYNNPPDHPDFKKLEQHCKYFVIGREVGSSGTPHLQCYLELNKQKTFTGIKKLFAANVHIEKRRGTAKQASDYCKKDNDFVQFGVLSKQGNRVDLCEIRDQIMSGSHTVDDITLENPMIYHQYGRTLHKIEDLYLRTKVRTEMTTCTWIYGATGVGKSHDAFANYSPNTHYIYPYDGDWWDDYRAQDTIVINDFRGQIPYDSLLRLIDKWPHYVRKRNSVPRPFISKHIIITSSLHPRQVYNRRLEKDDIAQLIRRIQIVHKGQRDSITL